MINFSFLIKNILPLADATEVVELSIKNNNSELYSCSIWTDDEEEQFNGSLHFFMPENGELTDFLLSDYLADSCIHEIEQLYREGRQDVLEFFVKNTWDIENLLLEGEQAI